MVKCMAAVPISGQMEGNTRENIMKIKRKEKEFLSGQTEKGMKEVGKMEFSMGLVKSSLTIKPRK